MDGSEEERREQDRRGGERRRYRDAAGRRDPAGGARRSEDRPRSSLVRGLGWLGVVLVLGLGWRALFVAPERGARAEARSVEALVAPVLAELALPLQAVPGFAPPEEGDPARGRILREARTEVLRQGAARLAVAAEAAPRESSTWSLLGPTRLALGDERGARLAWQEVVALGDPEAQGAAKVGLAVLAIRTGLRSAEEQDRSFALEHALGLLSTVEPESPSWSHALVEEAVIRLARGEEERVDVVLLELASAGGAVAEAALPALRAVRSGEERLSETLDAHLDPPGPPE